MSYGGGYTRGGYVGPTYAAPVPAPFKVEVDWAKDGFGADDDMTTRVRPRTDAISLQYGRDQVTALAPTVSGQGSITLDNRSQEFTPYNTASPFYGKIKPARPVRITRTVLGTVYTLFNGHSDDQPMNPDLDSRTVRMSLVDSFADFRGQQITTRLYRDIRTGTAIGLILDACGWSKTARALDLGATIVPWWWEDNTDAFTALEKLVRSEGPPALLTIGAAGEIVFRDRHHRLTDPTSITSQGVWRGSGPVEPVMTVPFTHDEAWRNIVNTGTATVEQRVPQARQEVWTSDATITLSSGEQKVVTVTGSDPFMNALTPVLGTDFQMAGPGSVTVRLLTRSGVSTAIELTAALGAPAIVTGLRLRAQPVTVTHSVQVSASDSTSVNEYGSRSFPGDLPWCGVGDAEAVLSLAVSQRANPLAQVSARFLVGKNAARSSLTLNRDLSDRVTVVESQTLLNRDFYVESIQHDLTGEDDHAVTFGLEAAPFSPTPVFRFETAGQGFGQGKFSGGLTDPATMFRFDGTDGHRFNQGTFCR